MWCSRSSTSSIMQQARLRGGFGSFKIHQRNVEPRSIVLVKSEYFTNMSPISELLNVILGAPYVSQAPFKRSRSAELSPSSSSSSCFTPGITCLRSPELWSILRLEGFPAIWACTFQTQSSMLLHHWFELEVPQSWWLHPHMCCFRSGKNEKRASKSVQKPT